MKMGLVHKEQEGVVDWNCLAQDRVNDGMLSQDKKYAVPYNTGNDFSRRDSLGKVCLSLI
jgi:hypothetical protein